MGDRREAFVRSIEQSGSGWCREVQAAQPGPLYTAQHQGETRNYNRSGSVPARIHRPRELVHAVPAVGDPVGGPP